MRPLRGVCQPCRRVPHACHVLGRQQAHLRRRRHTGDPCLRIHTGHCVLYPLPPPRGPPQSSHRRAIRTTLPQDVHLVRPDAPAPPRHQGCREAHKADRRGCTEPPGQAGRLPARHRAGPERRRRAEGRRRRRGEEPAAQTAAAPQRRRQRQRRRLRLRGEQQPRQQRCKPARRRPRRPRARRRTSSSHLRRHACRAAAGAPAPAAAARHQPRRGAVRHPCRPPSRARHSALVGSTDGGADNQRLRPPCQHGRRRRRQLSDTQCFKHLRAAHVKRPPSSSRCPHLPPHPPTVRAALRQLPPSSLFVR
eukprot:Rhum_TRINITY_DN9035_c0_g1::Rhum_TRINITY_DN9035_c0_g1_i1::g.31219::m.31219